MHPAERRVVLQQLYGTRLLAVDLEFNTFVISYVQYTKKGEHEHDKLQFSSLCFFEKKTPAKSANGDLEQGSIPPITSRKAHNPFTSTINSIDTIALLIGLLEPSKRSTLWMRFDRYVPAPPSAPPSLIAA